MEAATAGAITALLPQLGVAGLGLVAIGALGFWWLRASKDLREEKEGVIGRQNERIKDLKAELAGKQAELDKYKEAYWAVKYPRRGHPDPFDEQEAGPP